MASKRATKPPQKGGGFHTFSRHWGGPICQKSPGALTIGQDDQREYEESERKKAPKWRNCLLLLLFPSLCLSEPTVCWLVGRPPGRGPDMQCLAYPRRKRIISRRRGRRGSYSAYLAKERSGRAGGGQTRKADFQLGLQRSSGALAESIQAKLSSQASSLGQFSVTFDSPCGLRAPTQSIYGELNFQWRRSCQLPVLSRREEIDGNIARRKIIEAKARQGKGQTIDVQGSAAIAQPKRSPQCRVRKFAGQRKKMEREGFGVRPKTYPGTS